MIDVHLISHTHWDREWYLTREQFRLRLVDLVDRVIELLTTDSGYEYFHLDGQTIVLEDYLELRPERAETIRGLVRSGRLLVGPWYVMPDEFLVSGESLVRNLAIGHRIARSFGGSMPVGYLPDLFGHVGQMPQILRQFGLDNAILWRGFGGPNAEYWWEAPDGSRVLMMHLPGEGYCNATRIALVPDQMVSRTEAAIDREAARTRYGVVLLMNGVDHVEPQDTIPALVSALRERQRAIRHSTLPAYVAAVREAATRDGASLEVVRGELRGGEQYAPLLPGVLSARTYLKRANARVQNALERWAEPLSAWAWLLGSSYPDAALQYAWKVLLQNHPHDSICGCSIDEVHDENMSRFARAGQVADDLIERAATAIARRVAPGGDGRVRAVFFNTSGRPLRTVVEGVVDLPFGNAEPQRHVDPEALDAPVVFHPREATVTGVTLPDGTPVPFQRLEELEVISWVKSRYETPWALHARRIRFAAEIDLPACGYTAVDLLVGGNAPAAPATAPVAVAGRTIENGLLRVTVAEDGTAEVLDKRTGKTYARCGELLDEGDVGDEYNYSPPRNDTAVTGTALRDVDVQVTADGPLRGSLLVTGTLPVPSAAAEDRSARNDERVDLEVRIEIALAAGSGRLEWRLEVVNVAQDHRLRLTFPAGLDEVAEALSDTAFGTISRPARREPPAEIRTEVPVSAAPMQSFVACPAAGGAAVYVDGLHEYEILHDGSPRIAITLLRCVGDLSRDDLATRPHGHAGPGLATPGAQCLGVYEFAVAFEPLPHAPAMADLYASARALTTPPRMAVADAPGGGLPPRMEMLGLDSGGGDVILSALKKTDARESLTVRAFNAGPNDTSVILSLPAGIAEAADLNLLEEPQAALALEGEATRLAFSGFALKTVELRPARRPLPPGR
ncbi:MAG TPA: glycosyl hydrolase-related protein [Vicinamibacterales bacterium]|nr:glycosyl hydrolase-related protein [Vicinamibacterales bacterium]